MHKHTFEDEHNLRIQQLAMDEIAYDHFSCNLISIAITSNSKFFFRSLSCWMFFSIPLQMIKQEVDVVLLLNV